MKIAIIIVTVLLVIAFFAVKIIGWYVSHNVYETIMPMNGETTKCRVIFGLLIWCMLLLLCSGIVLFLIYLL